MDGRERERELAGQLTKGPGSRGDVPLHDGFLWDRFKVHRRKAGGDAVETQKEKKNKLEVDTVAQRRRTKRVSE